MNYTELDTPALCVDIDILDGNISRLQSACDELQIDLRVHTKTHKTPAIARRQIEAGAVGIVCQKLGEGEAMAAAGIRDILVPYNIVGRRKLERMVALAQSQDTKLTLAADSAVTIEGISAAMSGAGCQVRLLVEMDTGSHRCGTQSPQQTLELAQLIDRLPGTSFGGVMTYPSRESIGPMLDEVRELLSGAGLPPETVSGGGTGSERISKALGCTETRIGSYAWEGMTRVGKREDLDPGRCPLRLVTTVERIKTTIPYIKKQNPDAIIISSVVGSRNLPGAERLVKDIIRDELGIPVLSIETTRPLENIKKVDSQIRTFIEMNT